LSLSTGGSLNSYAFEATGEASLTGGDMNPWICALLISLAGAIGGVVNALLSDNGFVRPQWRRTVWCPGFIANVLLGAVTAFISWALYGAGAGVDLADTYKRNLISLRFSALAGAFVVGIAGAKWLSSEVDKKLLKESVKVVGVKTLTSQQCDYLVRGVGHGSSRSCGNSGIERTSSSLTVSLLTTCVCCADITFS
jgi:hypothetical protein